MHRNEYTILVNGRWVKTDRPMPVLNPYDNSPVADTYNGGPAELHDALDGAEKAFEALRSMPAHRKADALEKTAAAITAHSAEIARVIAMEAGKPIRDARSEAARAANTFKIAAEEAKRLGGEVIRLDASPGGDGRTGIIRRFPIGTVLGITPFNFPLNLVAHKVAPAMAAGNPIIVKPASKTPLSALILARIITEAGWPDGGVNVIPCDPHDAQAAYADERVKKLSFTGSAAVGWKLKALAGPKKVTLELGGNAGVIVHDDADVEYAAARCAFGSFAFAGQICISVQRIYAQREVYDAFTEAFLTRAAALKLGDPLHESTDVGPMIEEGALKRTEGWVAEAVKGGARVLAGGRRRGNCFEPTVLTGTKPSMKVCGEEVFAPVVTLEPYDEFDEAIAAVNSGLYGLQAGVFTNDLKRVFRAYERLEVGGVVINDVPTFRTDNMPYGGVKMSGFGKEGVKYAIEEMTEPRLLALNLG